MTIAIQALTMLVLNDLQKESSKKTDRKIKEKPIGSVPLTVKNTS